MSSRETAHGSSRPFQNPSLPNLLPARTTRGRRTSVASGSVTQSPILLSQAGETQSNVHSSSGALWDRQPIQALRALPEGPKGDICLASG
jgi:hypothetical protein